MADTRSSLLTPFLFVLLPFQNACTVCQKMRESWGGATTLVEYRENQGKQKQQPKAGVVASPDGNPHMFCGSCSACNYRTKTPSTKCKFGSRCTRKDCMYAHASPAGSAHMAGVNATACRSGIQCTLSTCSFAHPSKSLVCKTSTQDKADAGAAGASHAAKVCRSDVLARSIL